MNAQQKDRLTGLLGMIGSSVYVYQASLIEDSLLADAVGFVGGALLGFWAGQWLGVDIFAPGYGTASLIGIALVGLGGGLGLHGHGGGLCLRHHRDVHAQPVLEAGEEHHDQAGDRQHQQEGHNVQAGVEMPAPGQQVETAQRSGGLGGRGGDERVHVGVG